MNKNELMNVVSKDMELLLKKKEELIKEYNKEYEEMEYNLSNGTTSDVYEYFCGTLFLIEKHINEIENQLKALN
jgi:hypothetical protein